MNKLEILEKDYTDAQQDFHIFCAIHDIHNGNTENLDDYQVQEFQSLKEIVNKIGFDIDEFKRTLSED